MQKSGVNYQWQVINQSGTASIVGSASGYNVSIQGTGAGTVQLRLTASTGLDSTTLTKTITIQQPNLSFQNILGSYTTYGNPNTLYTLNATPATPVTATAFCDGTCNISWQQTGGSISSTISGNQASFTMVNFGSISFRITASTPGDPLANMTWDVNFTNSLPGPWEESTIQSEVEIPILNGQRVEVIDLGTGKVKTYSQEEWQAQSDKLGKGFYAIKTYNAGKLTSTQKRLVKE